jgi:hypothetical protein
VFLIGVDLACKCRKLPKWEQFVFFNKYRM